MIVTVTPTVMSDTVVRWYRGESAEELGAEQVSASRDGVIVNGYLHLVPDCVMATAGAAYLTLKRDRAAYLGHLATHRRKGMFGPLEPVPTTDKES